MDAARQRMSTMMRRVFGIATIWILLVAGCANQLVQSEEGKSNGTNPEGKGRTETTCTSDNDCMRSGCSGTVCQAWDAEPTMTTCEWREEYACFKKIECGCTEGQCVWQMTPEFSTCLEEKRQVDDMGR